MAHCSYLSRPRLHLRTSPQQLSGSVCHIFWQARYCRHTDETWSHTDLMDGSMDCVVAKAIQTTLYPGNLRPIALQDCGGQMHSQGSADSRCILRAVHHCRSVKQLLLDQDGGLRARRQGKREGIALEEQHLPWI